MLVMENIINVKFHGGDGGGDDYEHDDEDHCRDDEYDDQDIDDYMCIMTVIIIKL